MKIYKSYGTTIKDLDEKKGIVTVYANAFNNEDSDGDISIPGSFKKTLQESFKRLKWFLNHNPTQLLGVPIEGKEDEHGLLMTGQLNMQKTIAKDTLEDYKMFAEHGRTLEHSIGVQAIKRCDDDRRKVKEWKLWEYSTLTSWGANSMTPLVGIKDAKADGDNAREILDYYDNTIRYLQSIMRKGSYTDERFKQIDKKLKELKTLVQPGNSPTDGADFDPIKYLNDNLTLLKCRN